MLMTKRLNLRETHCLVLISMLKDFVKPDAAIAGLHVNMGCSLVLQAAVKTCPDLDLMSKTLLAAPHL